MSDILNAAEDAIPVVGEVKAGLSLAAAAWPIVAAVGGVGTIAAFGLWIHELQLGKARAEAQAAKSAAVAVVQTGQAAAAASAAQIVAQGVVQHDLTIHVQQGNQNAILAAPGAAQAIDAGLNAVGRRGLCRYAAYADDPECVGLRSPAAAPGPAVDPGNPAPAG